MEKEKVLKTIEEVVEQYGRLIAHIAGTHLQKPELVEEACQEVLFAIHRNREDIFSMEQQNQKRYICKMAHNISIRIYYKEIKHEGVSLDEEDLQIKIIDDSQVCEILSDVKIGPNIDRYIEKLSPGDQDMIVRKFYDEQPYEEIAEELGITPEAARKRMSRALRRLARLLEEDKQTFPYMRKEEEHGNEE